MGLHSCGSDHQGQALAEARCAYRTALLDDLIAYAATLPQPPTAAQVGHLWAHAQTLTEDGTTAARWVRKALDLGWRRTL